MNEVVLFIPLTKGYVAVIDFEDRDKIANVKWRVNVNLKNKYAIGYGTTGYKHMHRMLLNNPDREFDVDHIDGDGLNNCKNNLRVVTRTQNLMRSRKQQANNSSVFKGVDFYWKRNNYRARIKANGKQKHLGYFKTAQEAALAYDKAAVKYFGTFAQLNFVPRRDEKLDIA